MSAVRVLDPAIGDVERVLHEACGITLSETIRGTLSDALVRAARESGLSREAFLDALRSRYPEAVGTLVECAVVGETYFFRHPEQIAAISEELLSRAPLDAPLSIWSAGCATGEEPYTLAMALLDAGRALVPDRILATDVSSRSLAVAREGVYGEWSLRRLDPAIWGRHFEGAPPRRTVRPEVRRRVELARHNLVRDPPPGANFDLVVCRNVLIYFTPEVAREVASRLVYALKPGGLLAVAPVEMTFTSDLPLEPVESRGATLLRRVSAEPGIDRPAPAPPRRPAPARTFAPPVRPQARRPASRHVEKAAPVETPVPVPVPAPAAAGEAEAVRIAAQRGDLAEAERIAREAAQGKMDPVSWLLVSAVADARGDLAAAIDAARRALYLDPGLAMAHAALVPLFARAGLMGDAARARRNALDAIEPLDDSAPLVGIEPITAGALRSALGEHQAARRAGRRKESR